MHSALYEAAGEGGVSARRLLSFPVWKVHSASRSILREVYIYIYILDFLYFSLMNVIVIIYIGISLHRIFWKVYSSSRSILREISIYIFLIFYILS